MSRPLAAARWPRVYRPTGAHRALLGGLGGLLALGGVAGALWLALRQGAPGAWGLLAAANARLDRAAAERHRVAVLGKHVTTGKGAARYLRLAPAGAVPAREFSVGRGLYDATPVGATVCVELHPGALGLRWLSVDACP